MKKLPQFLEHKVTLIRNQYIEPFLPLKSSDAKASNFCLKFSSNISFFSYMFVPLFHFNDKLKELLKEKKQQTRIVY